MAAEDLTNCDSWPVHAPDSIQPFGYLLALYAEGKAITHWSANVYDIAHPSGGSAPRCLGDLLSPESLARLQATASAHRQEGALPPRHAASRRGGEVMVRAYRHARRLIVELEPHEQDDGGALLAQQQSVSSFAIRLEALPTPYAVCAEAAASIKDLTGYDRVMIYRFHDDFHGEVIAEAREPHLESWLGLHYPATDIPAPARAVFAANKIRMIPDVGYLACTHAFYAVLAPAFVHRQPVWDATPDLNRPLAWLEDDLRFFRMALRGREELKDMAVSVDELPELAGCSYVVQGASLGGLALYARLHARWGIEPGRGGSFLFGYGAATAARWRAFVAALDRLRLDASCEHRCVLAARRTFAAMDALAQRYLPSA